MPIPLEDATSKSRLHKLTTKLKNKANVQQPSYHADLDPAIVAASYNAIRMMMPINVAGAGAADFPYHQGHMPTYLPSPSPHQSSPAVLSPSVSNLSPAYAPNILKSFLVPL